MKIEFFYKCKDGRVIGKEAECKDKYEEKVEEIKKYTKTMEDNSYKKESVLEIDDE